MKSWQPIKTAPKDGTRVLLYFPKEHAPFKTCEYHRNRHYLNGKLTSQYEGWKIFEASTSFDAHSNPTHWITLPPMPE